MTDFRQEFLGFALAREVLRFGEFITKAGRKTPYFFNAGLFSDGASLGRLGEFYAQALLASGIEYDQLFGPAYKGITLAAATAIALAATGITCRIALTGRKRRTMAKGAPSSARRSRGRVVIVDDVITAGTSVRESVAIIGAAGAKPAGVLIALDRMERGQGEASAVQDIRDTFGIPVVSIATLDDVMTFIDSRSDLARMRPAIADYRARYGTH